jgi:hypothetical protein
MTNSTFEIAGAFLTQNIFSEERSSGTFLNKKST